MMKIIEQSSERKMVITETGKLCSELVENAMRNMKSAKSLTPNIIQNMTNELDLSNYLITVVNVHFHDPEVRTVRFSICF